LSASRFFSTILEGLFIQRFQPALSGCVVGDNLLALSLGLRAWWALVCEYWPFAPTARRAMEVGIQTPAWAGDSLHFFQAGGHDAITRSLGVLASGSASLFHKSGSVRT